jgi:hypothetical protein
MTFHMRSATAVVRMPRMEPGPSQKAKHPTALMSTESSSMHSKMPMPASAFLEAHFAIPGEIRPAWILSDEASSRRRGG